VPSPSAFPTKVLTKGPTPSCSDQIIDGSNLDVTIDEDGCKVWKVTGLIKSLTVASTSAAEVEGVDVTFAPGGGFSAAYRFLAVGRDGGVATNTDIAVAGSVFNDVYVGYLNGGTATNTNIAADVMGNVYVGVGGGEATETTIKTIKVDGSVLDVFVGHKGGEATNTNIAAYSMGEVSVGFLGEAADTTIAIGAGGGGPINVYGPIQSSAGATNTNIVNNGDTSVAIRVNGFQTGTKCNGALVTDNRVCICPKSPGPCK
jgi:hypothetical protein